MVAARAGLQANASVRVILFNDKEIKGVRTYLGHYNHLRVEVR
ncbi:hypothetical protein [Lentzea aerocolonigenes]|nr:hypothetical protein [Lentzea aerocolonigenes]MCP2242329.1 hypothetical protein [Lentzea aerocolonigenes]